MALEILRPRAEDPSFCSGYIGILKPNGLATGFVATK